MELRETYKIGPHLVRVRMSEDIDDCGQADNKKNEILIYPGLADSQQGETLLHEAMHIINSTMDHALLASLAQQIWGFLQDNNLLK